MYVFSPYVSQKWVLQKKAKLLHVLHVLHADACWTGVEQFRCQQACGVDNSRRTGFCQEEFIRDRGTLTVYSATVVFVCFSPIPPRAETLGVSAVEGWRLSEAEAAYMHFSADARHE